MSHIEIGEYIASYPLIDDSAFNQLIYNKKEFRDLQLDEFPEKPSDTQGDLLKHQLIISRFLASETPYDELYLWWETGVGKSCSMFGAIENNFDTFF